MLLGTFAVAVNAFPESGLAEFFIDGQRGIFRALIFVPILLASGLVLLKLPKGFLRDPQIAASLNDERKVETSGKAYRNAFVAVLITQAVVTPLFVSGSPNRDLDAGAHHCPNGDCDLRRVLRSL